MPAGISDDGRHLLPLHADTAAARGTPVGTGCRRRGPAARLTDRVALRQQTEGTQGPKTAQHRLGRYSGPLFSHQPGDGSDKRGPDEKPGGLCQPSRATPADTRSPPLWTRLQGSGGERRPVYASVPPSAAKLVPATYPASGPATNARFRGGSGLGLPCVRMGALVSATHSGMAPRCTIDLAQGRMRRPL